MTAVRCRHPASLFAVVVALAGLTLSPIPAAKAAAWPAEALDLSTLELVRPDQVPKFGNFYLIQRWPMPPLPCNTQPGLPVYALGNGRFLVDDRTVDYAAREAEARAAALLAQFGMASGMNGPSTLDAGDSFGPLTCTYGSNDLWLELLAVTNQTAQLLVHTPESAAVYDLFQTASLTTNGWSWIARGLPGQTWFSVTNLPSDGAFYILGTTNGMDTNGVTMAYRSLVGGEETLARDTDNDNLRDSWEILHFGNLDQFDNGDYDGDGVRNADELSAGSDPNTVRFRTHFASFEVNTTNVIGAISVQAGAPTQMAVLVDSDDFAGAQWHPFASTASVGLGATDGWHEAWIGLRGRSGGSEPAWRWQRFKLDRESPLLVVAGSVYQTASQPVVQVAGHCPEPLASLRFDLTSPLGTKTNQPGLVVRQHYDTNQWAFTTNDWQCFDLSLAPGTNVLTFRATDLAANTSVTSVTLILNLTNDHTAPVIALDWPLDGAVLGSAAFTWRGRVDDATASMVATVVDANGTTNTVAGQVERSGHFWAEGLVLAEGTNQLYLTATDAAGNVACTNIWVVRSPVQLTIGDFSAWDFHQPPITVSGTISASGYAVWVNGSEASVDGTVWQASVTPIRAGGMALVQAEARLSGGGGTNAIQASAGEELKERLYLASYLEDGRHEVNPWVSNWDYATNTQYATTWLDGAGGWQWRTDMFGPAGGDENTGWRAEWAGSAWPTLTNGVKVWWSNQHPATTNDCPPPLLPQEHCLVRGQGFVFFGGAVGSDAYWRKSQTEMRLETGGRAGLGRNSLFVLTAGAQAAMDESARPGQTPSEPPVAVPFEQIEIGQLGRLRADGRLFVVLPDGTNVDVTPRVAGTNAYSFTVWPTKHRLEIRDDLIGKYVTGQTNLVWTGEQTRLSCELVPGLAQQTTNHAWEVGGDVVAAVDYSAAFGKAYPLTDTTNASVQFYCVRDYEAAPVKCAVQIAGVSLDAKTFLEVRRPTVEWTLTPKHHVCVTTAACMVGPVLTTGLCCTTNDAGMYFAFRATDMKGYSNSFTFMSFQLLTLDWKDNLDFDPSGPTSRSVAGTGLDRVYPQSGGQWTSYSGFTTDTPSSELGAIITYKWRSDSFRSYLMWQPAGGVPVPLKVAAWGWAGRAQRLGSNAPYSFIEVEPSTNHEAAIGVDCFAHPSWTTNITDLTKLENWATHPFWYSTD